ncbi:hypothetical protein [Paenimyroides aestuarii]|uniref:Photosystem I assembly protein Ycf4 n=1 Tax=Paenimyroides aestuarii TaxID=2968490 RepID=A0ABY5NQA8_9FLAO|nr:hypothetical protein [Paenimyroides aestuarii]UUV20738.1 hypothetical protein NPX36_10370 [Paenimyroides aestuarii]
MNNYYKKKTDTINLYLELNVRASFFGKTLLLITILIALIPLFFFARDSYKNPENSSDFILPAIIIIGLIIIFPVRYLIWNSFGKEFIIINAKTISYNYNYRIITTNLKTIPFNKLATRIDIVKEENNIEYGKLVFFNYHKETNLPELIFETSVLLCLDDLKKIEHSIWELLNPKEESILNTFFVN